MAGKNSKVRLVFTIFIIMSFRAFSQQQTSASNSINEVIFGTGVMSGNGHNLGKMVRGIPLAAGEVVGDEFLNSEWTNGKIAIVEYHKTFDLLFRYNLRTDEVHIKDKEKIYALEGKRINTIAWLDLASNQSVRLVNSAFIKSNIPLVVDGLLQVLDSGKYSLYKKTFLDIKPPTYNAALQTGNKDTEILKKNEYYFAIEDKMLTKLKSKKSISLLTSNNDALHFMKTNNLSFKSEKDLIILFRHLNSYKGTVENRQ